jgi:hypothetical protein
MIGIENGYPDDESRRPGLMRRFIEGFRGFMDRMDEVGEVQGGAYITTNPYGYLGPLAFMPLWDIEPRVDEVPRVEPGSPEMQAAQRQLEEGLRQYREGGYVMQDRSYTPAARALLRKEAFVPADSGGRMNVARYQSDGTLHQDFTNGDFVAALRPDSEQRAYRYDYQDVKDLRWLNKDRTTSDDVVGRLADWIVFFHEPAADDR